ncbi:MAG: thioredoxin [Acidimicrobiia bacterium]|nr:thioredoxin [Acidimicrobiia bacterium]
MVDVTDATFAAEVLDRSKTTPVVVDLWAPWCGPCKTLGPIIEKVVAATNGQVTLAKVNVDENPQTAQAFKAQSIPAVHAIKNGEVVDSFIGAQPEAKVQEFVNLLLGGGNDAEVEALLAAGDIESLQRALDLAPENEAVVCAVAEFMIAQGDTDGAIELLGRIPESLETRRVAALARTGGEGPPADIDAKLADLLTRVKSDDEARQEFVDLLDLLGPGDDRTADWRRKLTTALF